ncbi:MAG: mechanosensitive ion channel family protein [Nitrospirales bacterium]
MTISTFGDIVSRGLNWFLTGGVRVILILVAIFLGLFLLRRALAKLQKFLEGSLPDTAKIKRARTLTHVLGDVVRLIIVVVGALMLLSELGIDLTPLLMAAGVGGIAIGFGAQSLVKDVLTGFFILFENQIRVGDVVTIAGTTAFVEEVRLRTTRMRDLSGNYHIIPNGLIDKVTNWTKDFSYYVFDMGVAYREDVDKVMDLIKEIGAELQADPEFGPSIVEPLEMLGVDQFADSAVVIKFRFKTKPIKQWTIGREMNRRIKKAFDARDIEIPFPHMTVYWGLPKEGNPPALHVVGMPTS